MKKLTIDDVTKEDWIIMRLLYKICNATSYPWQTDRDVIKSMIYIGEKYPDLTMAKAADLLREEYNRGK